MRARAIDRAQRMLARDKDASRVYTAAVLRENKKMTRFSLLGRVFAEDDVASALLIGCRYGATYYSG